MIRRSQRLQEKMSQGNENTKMSLPAEVTASASSSESELEKTIVEQQQNTAGENLESLKEEILKSSLQMYINAANTTTSVAVSQPPTFHHNVVAAPSTTMYYSVASMPSRTMDVPYTPTAQKLSIDHQHMFSQKINSPQYITPLFPQPLVQLQTYCPPSYAPTQQQLYYVPFSTPQSASYNLPPSLLSQAPMVSYPSYATHLFSGVTNSTSNDQPSQRLTVTPSTIIKTSTQPNVVLQSQQNIFNEKTNNYVPLLQQSQQQNTTMPSTYSQPQTSTFAATQNAGNVNNCLLQVPQQSMQTSMQNSIRKLHDLPEFNGQPEQWPMFAVSYKETTRMYNYSKLENVTRLQKALKGEAKAKVEAYLIHPECVDQVMSTLEFHFGRLQIMIRSQIAKVRSFPTISGKKMSEIINYSTMVSNLTVFLENAGASPHLCNLTLLEELVNKLPLSKREEWARFSLNNLGQYPTIRQFSTWLQEVATYVSFATEADSTKADFMQNKNGKVKQSFAITTDDSRKNLCVVCGGKHLIYYCSKFKNFSTADRWKVVKEKRLCFTCLEADHISQKCKNRQQCSVCGCQKYHNRLLHEAGKNNNNIIGNNNMGNGEKRASVGDSENATSSVTTIVDEYTNKKTLFKYLPVRLRGPKGYINIIAFIDDGSKISLQEEKVAKQIGLCGPYGNLSLGWIGGKKSSEMSMRIDVEIAKNIIVDDYFDVTPKQLIGLPHIRLVRPQNVMDLDENFSVHQTLLGNIVFGSNEESADNMVCVIDVSDYNDIQKQVAEYFSIEGFGMKPVLPVESEENKRAEAILKNTTVKIGDQYKTGLLWRNDDYAFKDTYSVALRRLQGIEAKMKNEILALKVGRRVSKKSPIFKLNPCLGDDGLIRISGRINNATCVGPSTRKPIIMPKNNLITKLIVKQYHEDFLHQNQESICAAIRTKFWIPSLRQLVRSSKKNCQICKNRSAVPSPPLMGQLPEDRVIPFVRAYSYTGVDFIGPYTVSLGRRSEKRWVALFTCLTTRAIHLELAKDLSTDAVILCLRNFINRRGVPVRVRSDRGTNFIGASKENFVFDSCKIGDECTRRGIEWVFNNPADPSAGGAWERMVLAVKNVLAFTMKEKSPQVETLNSLLIEAENLVNSRPLTHLPIESEDSEPLTPNHFLVGGPNFFQTPTVNENICLRKQWHILQQMKQTFWKRWIQEYLPDLVRRTKWFHPVPPIKVGDVVVVCDSNVARGEWKRGVVVEVCTAADSQVRSAVVKTSAGKLRRPASKLAVLDVGGESPDRFTGGGML
ncbi:uncharacterized protein isoform X2 [Musca autumnalis]|uniref:uncharacterized protein isoform X2 n=1 Tax=Musca autumnalis TaxID=221902 RepID=UPI003CF16424